MRTLLLPALFIPHFVGSAYTLHSSYLPLHCSSFSPALSKAAFSPYFHYAYPMAAGVSTPRARLARSKADAGAARTSHGSAHWKVRAFRIADRGIKGTLHTRVWVCGMAMQLFLPTAPALRAVTCLPAFSLPLWICHHFTCYLHRYPSSSRHTHGLPHLAGFAAAAAGNAAPRLPTPVLRALRAARAPPPLRRATAPGVGDAQHLAGNPHLPPHGSAVPTPTSASGSGRRGTFRGGRQNYALKGRSLQFSSSGCQFERLRA